MRTSFMKNQQLFTKTHH